jgi:hypothetical protein
LANSATNKREAPVSRETKRILEELKLEVPGLSWKRINTQGILISTPDGNMMVPNPKRKGDADFEVHVWSSHGMRIIWLETKRLKGGKQSAHQKFFEHKVKRRGEEYYIITDPHEQIKRIILNGTRT